MSATIHRLPAPTPSATLRALARARHREALAAYARDDREAWRGYLADVRALAAQRDAARRREGAIEAQMCERERMVGAIDAVLGMAGRGRA